MAGSDIGVKRKSDSYFAAVLKDGLINKTESTISQTDPLENMLDKMTKDTDKLLQRYIQISALKDRLPPKLYKILIARYGLQDFESGNEDEETTEDKKYQEGLSEILKMVSLERDPEKQKTLLINMLLAKGGKYSQYAMQIMLMGNGVNGSNTPRPEDDFTRMAKEHLFKLIEKSANGSGGDDIDKFTKFITLAKALGTGNGQGSSIKDVLTELATTKDLLVKNGLALDPKDAQPDPMIELEKDKVKFAQDLELKKIERESQRDEKLFDTLESVGTAIASKFGGKKEDKGNPNQPVDEIVRNCEGCGTPITFGHWEQPRTFSCPNGQCKYKYTITGKPGEVSYDDGVENEENDKPEQ